jgi:hypothetical protein
MNQSIGLAMSRSDYAKILPEAGIKLLDAYAKQLTSQPNNPVVLDKMWKLNYDLRKIELQKHVAYCQQFVKTNAYPSDKLKQCQRAIFTNQAELSRPMQRRPDVSLLKITVGDANKLSTIQVVQPTITPIKQGPIIASLPPGSMSYSPMSPISGQTEHFDAGDMIMNCCSCISSIIMIVIIVMLYNRSKKC